MSSVKQVLAGRRHYTSRPAQHLAPGNFIWRQFSTAVFYGRPDGCQKPRLSKLGPFLTVSSFSRFHNLLAKYSSIQFPEKGTHKTQPSRHCKRNDYRQVHQKLDRWRHITFGPTHLNKGNTRLASGVPVREYQHFHRRQNATWSIRTQQAGLTHS